MVSPKLIQMAAPYVSVSVTVPLMSWICVNKIQANFSAKSLWKHYPVPNASQDFTNWNATTCSAVSHVIVKSAPRWTIIATKQQANVHAYQTLLDKSVIDLRTASFCLTCIS